MVNAKLFIRSVTIVQPPMSMLTHILELHMPDLRNSCIWEEILNQLVIRTRAQSGKDWEPTFCIIDSQSVKTVGAAQERGIDGGKKN